MVGERVSPCRVCFKGEPVGQRKPEMRQDARPYLEGLAPYWAGVAQFTDYAGPHDMHSRRWECRAHWYLVDFSSQIPRPATFDRKPVQACECTFQLLEWQTLAWFCARSWPCFAVRMGSQELDFHGRREARNRPWGAADAAEMDSNGRASMYAELARPCALFVGRSWPRSAVCLLRQLEKRLPSHPRKCFLEKTPYPPKRNRQTNPTHHNLYTPVLVVEFPSKTMCYCLVD